MEHFGAVANAAGSDASMLAEQLFSVVEALDSSGSLRRALTDPARPGTDKGSLVTALFGGLDSRVRDVVEAFVDRRWVQENDLGDAIEDAAVDAYLAAVESEGGLDAFEEEMFRVERFLASERDLLSALGERSSTPEARVRLARDVFGDAVGPTTLALIERAAREPRKRRLPKAIDYYIAAAAARRAKSVVDVTSAVELSTAHRTRLTTILRARLGRDVQVNVSVDPRVVGGMRIQVGDQVVDGTTLSKLDEARRRLVG
jgi:F-type H+-transporting ATPase subunit delta